MTSALLTPTVVRSPSPANYADFEPSDTDGGRPNGRESTVSSTGSYMTAPLSPIGISRPPSTQPLQEEFDEPSDWPTGSSRSRSPPPPQSQSGQYHQRLQQQQQQQLDAIQRGSTSSRGSNLQPDGFSATFSHQARDGSASSKERDFANEHGQLPFTTRQLQQQNIRHPTHAHHHEVAFVKVTGDRVHFENASVAAAAAAAKQATSSPPSVEKGFFGKFARAASPPQHQQPYQQHQPHVERVPDNMREQCNITVGPPPPSPPASVERIDALEIDQVESHPSSQSQQLQGPSKPITATPMMFSRSEPAPRQLVFADDASAETREEQRLNVGKRKPPSAYSRTAGDAGSLHRASTDTRVSTILPSSASGLRQSEDSTRVPSTDTPYNDPSSSSGPVSKAHVSVDGYLHPPLASPMRAQRRNTTGSAKPLGRQHPDGDVGSGGGGDIEDDIEQQAAQIRKERARAKAAAEAEAALTRRISASDQLGGAQSTGAGSVGPDGASAYRSKEARGSRGEKMDSVLVGNLIGEDHANYVLMYNMLTGIRIAVSRCQAKIKRPLTAEDFTARHKYSFDIVGNELTPSAKYDFKFKDYAPWVFRELREDYFGLDPADYLLSLTAKYILSELGSPGKSGSFFYFSRDYRFIIKTIHHSEHKFLLSILPQYHAHIKNNPHTLVSRFYGLHRVKLPRGRKIHFVIMNNLFPPHKDVHETFDLKGSTVGREYPEAKLETNPRAVMKDLNWINRHKQLELGPEKRALLTAQLERDAEMLKAVKVMDYSLLVGIHYIQRGNRENVRSKTLKVFDPAVPIIRRKTTHYKGGRSPEALAMRRAMGASDPKRLTEDSLVDKGDGSQFIFYQDEGGLRATDEENNETLDMIYYLGVIDILTPYNTKKSLEHFWKGLSADRHKISPVPPSEYGDRFFAFMKAVMRGGGGGDRFKPDYKPESESQHQSGPQPAPEPQLEPQLEAAPQ